MIWFTEVFYNVLFRKLGPYLQTKGLAAYVYTVPYTNIAGIFSSGGKYFQSPISMYILDSGRLEGLTVTFSFEENETLLSKGF